MHLTIAYDLLPRRRSTRTSIVMDHFGIGFETGKHIVAEDVELTVEAGDVVCFTGASGSGKSSLMRAAAGQLSGVIDAAALELPEETLIDAIDLPVPEALRLLSCCGLAEAQLLLRRPRELSDGQRYRFRLALALSRSPEWVLADEFTATLDRDLAKVVAFNVRRHANRAGVGFLLATTHDDVLPDLQPSLHVRCRLDGQPEVTRCEVIQQPCTLAAECDVVEGTKSDWNRFSRWHYRGHNLGITRFVTLLRLRGAPIGICVFTSAALSLAPRNRFFGRSGGWSRLKLQTLNRQLVALSRVVIHPAYRGAGLAAEFIRESCRRCSWPWIETLAEMGHLNPFFEKAGFVKVGTSRAQPGPRRRHSEIYGTRTKRHGRKPLVTHETNRKSRYARPVYYVFDNRDHQRSRTAADDGV